MVLVVGMGFCLGVSIPFFDQRTKNFDQLEKPSEELNNTLKKHQKMFKHINWTDKQKAVSQ